MEVSRAGDLQKEIKIYISVFVALGILTVITVTVSRLHFPLGLAIAAALLIATIKGGLVACYFMHLISERKLIYALLVMTVFFFAGLLLLTFLGFHDDILGTTHVS